MCLTVVNNFERMLKLQSPITTQSFFRPLASDQYQEQHIILFYKLHTIFINIGGQMLEFYSLNLEDLCFNIFRAMKFGQHNYKASSYVLTVLCWCAAIT